MKNAGTVRTIVIGAIAAAVLAAPTAASAVQTTPNPWLTNRFLNIAHQGGEDEVPSATMYALKSAITEGGADMLEIDVQLTKDPDGMGPEEGTLVVLHDDIYDTKSCLPALCPDAATDVERPATQIRDMELDDLQDLDAAYWFRKPGSGPASYGKNYAAPASEFPFRGVRTGDKPPPAGYTANDFRIPTLKEVLDTFPTTPINIEIKMPKSPDPVRPYNPDCSAPAGPQICDDLDLTIPTTNAMIDLFNTAPYSNRRDVIVVSFAQEPMAMFAAGAPDIHRAPSVENVTNFFFTGAPPTPDIVVFQVPPTQGPLPVPELLLGNTFNVHGQGYGVHVFTDGDSDETPTEYQRLYNVGVDGIMTSRPRAFHAWACTAGIRRPDGSARCPAQDPVAAPPVTTPPADTTKKCKKGQKLKKGKCVKKKKKKKKAKKK